MTSKRRLPLVDTRHAAPAIVDAPSPGPTREALFREHFLRYYPAGATLDEIRATDANPAENPTILGELEDTARRFAKLAPVALREPTLDLDLTDASIHRLAQLITSDFRDRAMKEDAGGTSLFVAFVIHACAYLGECARRGRDARWRVRSPLWESRVEVSGPAGTFELAPFSIWLGVFSGAEIDRATLGDRYRTLVEAPTFDGDALPRWTTPRELPRLKAPRYDLLVKYLQAHLPEVKDLGAHFPGKERFGELAFHTLDFLVVGDGRALVMHGPRDTGIQLFWIGADGFEKSFYLEADTRRPYQLRDKGPVLELTFHVPSSRAPQVQELLWWGP